MAKKAAGSPSGKSSSASKSQGKPVMHAAPRAAPAPAAAEPAPRPTGTLLFRLLFVLIPLLQMLWTSEAPRRPFAAVRDPATGVVSTELIQPRILLVAAHPHDVLLFAPTAVAMLAPDKRKEATFFALTLSCGAGKVEEWAESWNVLGLEEERRFILDIPELKDSTDATWEPSVVAEQVEPFVLKHNIDTILTFDAEGITGSPHHTALRAGIAQLLSSPSLARALAAQPTVVRNPTAPRLLTLRTAPWTRNLSLLTPLVEHMLLGVRGLRFDAAAAKAAGTRVPTHFVSGVKAYVRSWRALLAYEGQRAPRELALWAVGRSLWVNEWVEA